ncbi:MAG: hypothetical protein KAR31_12515, partial [Candidatus Omnitrophica bacterium]|nr:hypothetical protein [Candidatus Omnitrophota bacterium]
QDKEKLKKNTLIALVLWMLLMNIKKIIKNIRSLLISLNRKALSVKDKRDPLLLIYRRYEQYLKTAFDETRRITDTDQEVIRRIKVRPQIPAETVAKMESFVDQYHATRFGFKEDIDLKAIIRGIEEDKKNYKNIGRDSGN